MTKAIVTNIDRVSDQPLGPTSATGNVKGFRFEVRQVPLEQLHIDERYQRGLKPSKIKEMDKKGGGFDPVRAGCLTTIRRICGDIFIIDGQHRYALARQCGEKHILCLIWYSTEAKPINEPQAFVNLNTLRKALSRADAFKALLEANDARTWKIAEILEKHGLTATTALNTKGANLINAIGAVESIFDIGGAHHLDTVLKVLLASFENDIRALNKNMLMGMHEFLNRYAEQVKTKDLGIPELISKLSKYSLRKLEQKAAANAEARGGDIRSNVGRAVLDIYNTGRRSNRLPNKFD